MWHCVVLNRRKQMRNRKLTFYFRETVHEPVDGRLIQIQYLVKMLMVSHHPGDVKDRGREKEGG